MVPKQLGYKYLGTVSYLKALSIQEQIYQLRKPNYSSQNLNSSSLSSEFLGVKDLDLLLLLQHPPTYTEGRRQKSLDPEVKKKLESLGAEYINTLRGGQTTFHGPGQLVGYPIISLKNNKLSTKCYISYLERFLIGVCDTYGIKATTTSDTGVWVGNNKIAAMGVLIRQYITTHGFALNCNTDLSWFDHIVPCGLKDKGVTSISQELLEKETAVAPHTVLPTITTAFARQFKFSAAVPLSTLHPALDRTIDRWIDKEN